MVVTHTLAAPSTGSTSPAKTKKNRRKIVRKNPGNTDAFPSGPSSSSHPYEGGEDEEMTLTPLDAGLEGQTRQKTTDDDDDELMIDTNPTSLVPSSNAPAFPPVAPGAEKTTLRSETRRIPIPPHRMTPLKKDWLHIFGPLTEILGLQVRMNVQRRCVEIRVRMTSSLFEVLIYVHRLAYFRRQDIRRILVLFKRALILSKLMPWDSMSM